MPAQGKEAERLALMMEMQSQKALEGACTHPQGLSSAARCKLVSAPWPLALGLLHPLSRSAGLTVQVSLFAAHTRFQLSSQPHAPAASGSSRLHLRPGLCLSPRLTSRETPAPHSWGRNMSGLDPPIWLSAHPCQAPSWRV